MQIPFWRFLRSLVSPQNNKEQTTCLSFPARFTAKKLHLALFNFVKKYVTLQQNFKNHTAKVASIKRQIILNKSSIELVDCTGYPS